MTRAISGNRNPDVYETLVELQRCIASALPSRESLIEEVEAEAIKGSPGIQTGRMAKVTFREGAFVSHFVVPAVHSFLVEKYNLDKKEATKYILSENRLDNTSRFSI